MSREEGGGDRQLDRARCYLQACPGALGALVLALPERPPLGWQLRLTVACVAAQTPGDTSVF